MIHIRVTQGTAAGEEIKTGQRLISIGRGPACDLTLADRKVSHVHGEIFWVGARCVYRDLLSRNGSVIRTGGQHIWLGPLTPEWYLIPGDEIVVGDTAISLLAADPETPAGPAEFKLAFQTMGVDLGQDLAASGPANTPGEIVRFNKLLQLRAYDPTDVLQVKRALCAALREVFPSAACAALVELVPGSNGQLHGGQVNREAVVSDPPHHQVPFSFHVLREAHRRQVPVLFSNRPAERFPEAVSIRRGEMTSCLCAPLWNGTTLTGFVHLHTEEGGGPPFTQREVQLLWLLASVTGLVLQGARAAEERSTMRALASAGQIVAGFAHDAGKMIQTLGFNADGVQRSYPALADNASWQELRRDLEFVRFVARDTMDRLSLGKRILEPRRLAVRTLVEDALDRCRRYFLDEAHAARVCLLNTCDPCHTAVIDPLALTQVLVNCLKNALDALNLPTKRPTQRPGTVCLTSCPDPEEPERFLTLSVCDDGGGIPPQVLARLADRQVLVSTKGKKGSGLGLHLVVDLIGRLNGRVRLASSTEAVNGLPAGTVVSLCLPWNETLPAPETSELSGLEIVPHYGEYRARIESH